MNSSGKVKCTCGWSWNKSDSSKKDMYICHECGRDNSNNMKNGGWLDGYADDVSQAQNGIEGTMGGLTDKGFNYNGAWGGQFEDGGLIPIAQKGYQTSKDSVAHQANKILKYEQLRGGPGGIPLPQYADPQYMDMLMNKVYPEVKKIMPKSSAMEIGEAMDFIFNAGWDKANNKITKDPRAFALQEYYRQYDPSKLDKDGKWSGRKNAPYSFDQEYANTIGKLPENQRRLLMNKGRDWYYKNINNPAPGVPSSDYNDTWYGRIWNTNDYNPFNPNNPKFTPKKQMGGYVYPVNYVPQAQEGKTVTESTAVKKDRLAPSTKNIIKKLPGTNIHVNSKGEVVIKDDKGVYKPHQSKQQPEIVQGGKPRSGTQVVIENKQKQAEAKKKILKPLDVTTDVMQLGNFGPHPALQAIGKVGNIAGGLLDAYQAYDAFSEGDYVSGGINAASVALPFGLDAKTFRRNSKYLQPGQPLYPLSPQAGIFPGGYSRTNYIEPFAKVRGMSDQNLLANRALLGTLGAETVYDTELIPEYQMGGSIPGAVGFTYARTKGIPSEGPYAKKTMPSAQNGIVRESTSVNKNRRIPSTKDIIKKIPGTNAYKDVYGNLLEKDKSGVYKPRQREEEEVRQHVPQSKLSKIKEIALNPMTAAGYKVRNEDIPDNFSRSEDTRNNLDTAVDFINPVYYAESAKNLVESQGQVFSDLSEGNFQDAALNQLMAGVEALNFIPIAKGAKPFVQKGMKQLKNIPTSISPELRQGLRTQGLTFNGIPRKYPINNSQRAITEDVDRLFQEFPELAKIGSKEDYMQHLENIYPESTQPGIFYRGSNNPNLNASEWVPNPSGGNNLGQGFYFTPDPFKAQKYGKEAKALLNIKDPTYTSLRLNTNNGFMVPDGMMTKDLVEDGSGILSVQNPNRDLFTEMGSRAEGYLHKYKGPLDEQGFPAATRPYSSSPHYVEYNQIDEIAVPDNSQIHVLGSDADTELFKNYINNNKNKQGLITADPSFEPKFNSEIDWSKWNPEIPNNTQLMKEYNAIEQTSKANGTWMKNPDGSAFQGTPEQFVQQNSENFKKAFPNGFKETFRGTLGNEKSLKNIRDNRAVFTANEELAKKYAGRYSKGNVLGPESDLNEYATDGVYQLAYPETNNSLIFDANNSSWENINLSSLPESNISDDLIALEKRKKEFASKYDQTLKTDDIASYVEKSGVDNITIKNINDSGFGDVSTVLHRPGNYLKSLFGNNGMFDMTNPNIYKSVVPGAIGLGAASQLNNEEEAPEYKQGGIIKDDRGQWEHPGEITEINSPYITMKGVPYPVLGISDTGDTQMMYPEEEYEFDGTKVTEFPMAKNGLRQEQKGLVNLDNLLNFTNYNTKQPGGWLDKY